MRNFDSNRIISPLDIDMQKVSEDSTHIICISNAVILRFKNWEFAFDLLHQN